GRPRPPGAYNGWRAAAGLHRPLFLIFIVASAFADLAQNLGAMFTEPWRRPIGSHRHAVEHDRGADAGADAAFGARIFQLELHAAVNHLRIGKDLLKVVDGACRDSGAFKFVQELFAFEARRQRGQLADQHIARGEAALVVLVVRIFRELRRAQDAAKSDILAVVACGDDDQTVGDWKNLIGNEIGVRVADAL